MVIFSVQILKFIHLFDNGIPRYAAHHYTRVCDHARTKCQLTCIFTATTFEQHTHDVCLTTYYPYLKRSRDSDYMSFVYAVGGNSVSDS